MFDPSVSLSVNDQYDHFFRMDDTIAKVIALVLLFIVTLLAGLIPLLIVVKLKQQGQHELSPRTTKILRYSCFIDKYIKIVLEEKENPALLYID